MSDHHPKRTLLTLIITPIAFLFGMGAVLVSQTALAGPITKDANGLPYTKLAVYQGVVSIVPGGAGDSVMEIGNAGRDIASTGGLFLRPGSSGSVSIGAQDGTLEGGDLVLNGAGSNPAWTVDSYGSMLRFHSSGAEKVTIQQTGSVGIGLNGLATPLAKLAVNNGATGSGSAGDGVAIYSNTGNSTLYAQQNGAGWAGYFSGRVFATSLTLGNLTKSSWPIQVCDTASNACLGPYLYATGTTTSNLTFFYYAGGNTISPVAAFYVSDGTTCAAGTNTVTGSAAGRTYYDENDCGGDATVTSPNGIPYVTSAPTRRCIDPNPVSLSPVPYKSYSYEDNIGVGCHVVQTNGTFYYVNGVAPAGTTRRYELR